MDIKPSCFLTPCSKQPTVRIINALPELYGCYLHSTEIVKMLKEGGYPDSYLEPITFVQRTLPPLNTSPSVPPRQLPPLVEIPACMFANNEPRHRRGALLVTADCPADELKDMEFRCCPNCFHELTDNLRSEGYSNIRATAPEAKSYQSWRNHS